MRCPSHAASAGAQARLLVVFFNDTATTEIYTLSLHDALPILAGADHYFGKREREAAGIVAGFAERRSEEHTSELQSRFGISYAGFWLKKKMPQPRISIQPSPSPKRISPLSRRYWMSTSSEGSVNGKNDGRNRMPTRSTSKKALKNSSRIHFMWPRCEPLSISRPSI